MSEPTDVTDAPTSSPDPELKVVESYEQYIARIQADGGTPVSRSDWARESGSVGAGAPDGVIGSLEDLPHATAASGADSAALAGVERTDFTHDQEVQRVQMEGTQIDPADGVRKPVDQITPAAALDAELTPTADPSVEVFVDNRVTQIGPDGKRHPVDGSEGGPTGRFSG